MADKNQTPAPKVSSERNDDVKPSESNLKKNMAEAEKGAAKKTTATKTPQKIQEGKTGKHKRKY